MEAVSTSKMVVNFHQTVTPDKWGVKVTALFVSYMSMYFSLTWN
jgi:hypothetical protein